MNDYPLRPLILLVSCFSFFSVLSQQHYLNLDFESNIYGTRFPKTWNISGPADTIELDSLERISGKKSLKISRLSTKAKKPTIILSKVPKVFSSHDTLTFIGSIKTINVEKGFVGLMVRVDGNGKILAFDNMADRGLNGNTEWTEVSIKIAIPDSAEDIYIGSIFAGSGTAYLDSFIIVLDNEKYKDEPLKTFKPKPEDVELLSKKIYPINGFNPTGESHDDLSFLKEKCKNAKIIALGESSHGSREIFLMKHKLLKFFQKELNFNHFSMEADMVKSKDVNTYASSGIGNPSVLLKDLGFWTWDTEEVLQMIQWIFEFNLKSKSNTNIVFSGFDMQSSKNAILELQKNYDLKKIDKATLVTKLDSLKKGKNNQVLIKSMIEELDSVQATLVEKNPPSYLEKQLLQSINLVKQSLDPKLRANRDEYMAENVKWLFENYESSKMILWAHNGHVKKSGESMGSYLKKYFGDEYLSIGFAFHSGFYNAKGKEGLKAYEAQNSYPGTYEHYFKSVKEPIFLLDLRETNAHPALFNVLKNQMEFRIVGARKLMNEFYPTKIMEDFDFLIFINETSASKLLNVE